MPTKKVMYDARSLNPHEGDQVTVLVQHQGQDEMERLTAVYLGSTQLEAYTTPYFKFLVSNQVRLINANAVREWRYTLAAPNFELPQIEAESDNGGW